MQLNQQIKEGLGSERIKEILETVSLADNEDMAQLEAAISKSGSNVMPKSHAHGSGGHSNKNKDAKGEMTFAGSGLMQKRLMQRKFTTEGATSGSGSGIGL